MRKLIAVIFVLLITVSVTAAPNDSSDRSRGTFQRIVRQIKAIIHILDDGQPIGPIPTT